MRRPGDCPVVDNSNEATDSLVRVQRRRRECRCTQPIVITCEVVWQGDRDRGG